MNQVPLREGVCGCRVSVCVRVGDEPPAKRCCGVRLISDLPEVRAAISFC